MVQRLRSPPRAMQRRPKVAARLRTHAPIGDAQIQHGLEPLCSVLVRERAHCRGRRAEAVVHGAVVPGERCGRGEMEGQVVHPVIVRRARQRLQRLRDTQVQGRPARRLEPVGHGTAQQLVPEAIGDARARDLLEHVTARRLVE